MNAHRTLIISVFIVASCGLAYELIIAALASYLLGDSILQFSSVIGLYLFSMGIGAHLTQYIKDKDVLHRFIEIELLVGIIGGISALALFVAFGLSAAPFRTLLYAFVLIVGMIVGMEIPLVMRVLNQKGAEFKELVSKVLTFDYLGALAVSLLFPLLLAPKLGMARFRLVVWYFQRRRRLSDRACIQIRITPLSHHPYACVYRIDRAHYALRLRRPYLFQSRTKLFRRSRRLSKPFSLPTAGRDTLERRYPSLYQR